MIDDTGRIIDILPREGIEPKYHSFDTLCPFTFYLYVHPDMINC